MKKGSGDITALSTTKSEAGNNLDSQSSNVESNNAKSLVYVAEGESVASPPRIHSVIEIPSDEMSCRICREAGGVLVTPCKCRGSIGLVHLNCLETWLAKDRRSSCELCGWQFEMMVQEERRTPYCMLEDHPNNNNNNIDNDYINNANNCGFNTCKELGLVATSLVLGITFPYFMYITIVDIKRYNSSGFSEIFTGILSVSLQLVVVLLSYRVLYQILKFRCYTCCVWIQERQRARERALFSVSIPANEV